MKKIFMFILFGFGIEGFGQVTLTGNSEYKLEIAGYIGTCKDCCGDIYGLRSISSRYANGNEISLFTGRKVNEFVRFETTYTKKNPIAEVNYGIKIRWKTGIGCNGGPADRNKTYSINSCSFIQNSPGDGLSAVKITSRPAVTITPPTEPLYLADNKDLTITLPNNIDDSYYRWRYKIAGGIAKDFPSSVNFKSTLKIRGKDFLNDSDDSKEVYVWVEMNCDAGEKLGETLSPAGPDYGGCSQAIWVPWDPYSGDQGGGGGYWEGEDDIECMNVANEIYNQQKAEIIRQNQSRTSNIINFTYKLSCPTMTPISSSDAMCYGDKGSVNFGFDSELLDLKEFFFVLHDSNTNKVLGNMTVDKKDIENLKYTLTGLNPGSYYIRYQARTSIGTEPKFGSIPLTTSSFKIGRPDLFSFAAIETQPQCNDAIGKITITASGGTPPYYYYLNNDPKIEFTSPKTIDANTRYNYIKVEDSKGCIDNTKEDKKI